MARSVTDDVRAAVDAALKECVYFTMIDQDGHVDVVDGDIDTGDVAEDLINRLSDASWQLVRKS